MPSDPLTHSGRKGRKDLLSPDPVPILSKGNALFLLTPTDQLYFRQAALEKLVQICNEPSIERIIQLSGGAPGKFSYKDAVHMVAHGREGWEKASHFQFILVDRQGLPAGAVEIKSSEKVAEIGYWLTEKITGLMTEAVAATLKWSKLAGFEMLFAITEKTNLASCKVLEKNGFYRQRNVRGISPLFAKYIKPIE